MEPMRYPFVAIADDRIPRAAEPAFQHALDTYVSETNKVASVWRELRDADLSFRPHPRSTTVGDILRHQLLSERRFFGEFIGAPEPAAADVLPHEMTVATAIERLVQLASARLGFLAPQRTEWWLARVPFFEVERERVWVFWRRVLHTAHHRTQLTVYLRMMDRSVPPTYGPTADVKWDGADPTNSVAAAGRK
ncbi:MAG: DinB family protein [Gemmatimonadaceae bacterium]|nr:DinB family protein [Gemmatimonadaceae bacterium]